eukprot:Clim_evm73s152 gene=Clim_evmTU73s152
MSTINPLLEADFANKVLVNPIHKKKSSSALYLDADVPLLHKAEGWVKHPDTTAGIEAVRRNIKRNDYAGELAQRSFRWYFAGKSPSLWVGTDGQNDPVVIARTDDVEGQSHRCLIFKKEGTKHVKIPSKNVKSSSILPKKPKPYHCLRKLGELMGEDYCMYMKWVNDEQAVSNKLLHIEDDYYRYYNQTQFKFGVVLVREGQVKEQEFFSNMDNSLQFRKFCGLLGQRVRLLEFDKFRGGLDVSNDRTGLYSVYREWKDKEVMFHISTLLPYSENDVQQVQRKRHIGNDACFIVFLEDPKGTYDPVAIRSRFNHVVAVIRPVEGEEDRYQFAFASKTDVPHFGPDLETNFADANEHFVDHLLTKLVNGQQSALQAEQFSKSNNNYRGTLLCTIVKDYSSGDPVDVKRFLDSNGSTDLSKRSSITRTKHARADFFSRAFRSFKVNEVTGAPQTNHSYPQNRRRATMHNLNVAELGDACTAEGVHDDRRSLDII